MTLLGLAKDLPDNTKYNKVSFDIVSKDDNGNMIDMILLCADITNAESVDTVEVQGPIYKKDFIEAAESCGYGEANVLFCSSNDDLTEYRVVCEA